MIVYILIALAFAIMYSFRYANKIIGITEETVNLLEVEWGTFSPTLYHLKEFTYNFIAFPWAVLRIFKPNLIRKEVGNILETNYGLTAEK